MKIKSFHNLLYDHGRREVVEHEFGADITIIHDKLYWLGVFIHVAHHARNRTEHVHEPACKVITERRAKKKRCDCSWRDVLPKGDIEVSLMHASTPYRTVSVPDEAGIEAAIENLITGFDELDFIRARQGRLNLIDSSPVIGGASL